MNPSGMMQKYLKVAVTYINDSEDLIDLKLGRPLKIEDFDTLSSEMMLKIVAFLLRGVIGDMPIRQHVPLTTFHQFGAGAVTYDCGIDQIYHAAKQIFPENDKMFHYSVLLLPAKNPQRTKTVIAYIIEFLLMCEDLCPLFKSCFDKVMAENKEKVELCAEIEELNKCIAEEKQKLHEDKERLSLLKQEAEKAEETIRQHQRLHSNLQKSVKNSKVKYEEQEMKLESLKQELENLSKTEVELKAMVVVKPKEMEVENSEIKKKFDEETKKREKYAIELEQMRKDCESYETLKDKVNGVIQIFENLLPQMEQTKKKMDVDKKLENDRTQLERKLEQLRKQCSLLEESCNSKRQNLDQEAKKHEDDLTKLRNETQDVKLKQDAVRAQIVEEKKDIKSLQEEMNSLQKECNRVEQEIYDVTYAHKIGIPQERKQLEIQCKATITKNQEQFSFFPLLDRDPLPKSAEIPSSSNNPLDA